MPSDSHRSLPGGLYLVATPIGNARDITLRALDILASAEIIAAEDTRTARRLMEIHAIPLAGRRLLAYHEHSDARTREQLLEALRAGRSVACVSEAGTPGISDPGFELVRAAAAEGLRVFAAPGPSALIAGLAVSGLPTDRFLFAGFPPPRRGARSRWFADLAARAETVVLYESPHRILATLQDLAEAAGEARPAALCRELTKKFEEVIRGTLGEILDQIAERERVRGEIVLVLGGKPSRGEATEKADAEGLLREAMKTMRTKDAVAAVAEATGLPKKELYTLALTLRD